MAYTYDVFDRRIARKVDTTSPFDLADAAIESYVHDGDDVLLDCQSRRDWQLAAGACRRYLHGLATNQYCRKRTPPPAGVWHLTS